MGMQRTIFAVIAVLAVLAIGGVFLLGKQSPATPAGAAADAPAIENPDPLLRAHLIFGSPKAPVTVVEFGNYRCPHCRDHALKVLPRLFSDYVEKGRVRYVFRALPFAGQDDVFTASVAAECVYDQDPDRFLDYHTLLFRAVRDWAGASGEALTAKLADYARQLSLDAARLRACLKDPAVQARVRFDRDLAIALGVSGTPTFYVNGEKQVGFMPFERWQALLK